MEKHSVPGLSKGTALPSGFASASGCSVNWASGCANHAPLWPMLIPRHRKHIKKTPSLDAGRERRSVGDRRSALSAAWLALPHVDPARNQGPGPAARPHPQECRVFRSRALAGWALCVPSGNRQIQWAQLPSVPPATPLRQPRNRETGCGHHRQCPLSPLPPAPTVAGTTRPSPCPGPPALFHPPTQPQPTDVLASPPPLPALLLLLPLAT